MPRFVVLLRGVNVGKGPRVPMAEFRRLLEDLGHADVRTLLNSGNAVFSSPGRSAGAHATAISAALHEGMGASIPVVVNSASDFGAIVAECPIAPPEGERSRFLVAFPREADALRDLLALAPLANSRERYVVGRRAAYLYCAGGILQSRVANALLGKAGRGVTTRNWATVLKLEELLHVRAA
jgi:uncharacterized protein (DUF1697 family)